MITIWHNPRCSKSRQTLALLQGREAKVTERHYLEDAPTGAEIRAALVLLGIPAIALMRTSEPEFRAAGLTENSDEASLVAAMAATPKLIERPLVFANGKAALGRPPEAVLAIL
ncbi:MAG: arsenate reductase (glutaredoxin) [Rhodobacteraceae bacterium]|nr:arsenate reductase (glutaredoxin) [Paracoccaceae bacterium]